MYRFLQHCLNRTPVLGVLMAVLFFRALIPQGFMLGQTDGGAMEMQFCSGATVLVDMDGSNGTDGHRNDSQTFEPGVCAFAASAPGDTPPVAPTLDLQLPRAVSAPAPSQTIFTVALHPKSRSARGPPAL